MKVYDTSALLEMYDNLELNSDCYISTIVLNELENIKTSYSKDREVKSQARQVVRILQRSAYSCWTDTKRPVERLLKQYNKYLDDKNDTRILLEAYHVSRRHPVEFYTGDNTLYLFAKNLFESKRFKPILVGEISKKRFWDGMKEITPTEEEWDKLYNIAIHENFFNLKINEYGVLYKDGKIVDICRWDGEDYVKLGYQNVKSNLFGKISPRNLEQKCYFDLLQNPDVPVVNCIGRTGSGKAIDNNALIPTPKGFIRMGDIKKGDYVFDRLGKPTKVLEVYPQGMCDAYEVYFADGRKVCCNDEHLWTYYSDNRGNLNTRSLRGIIDSPRKDGYKIPTCEPVEYSHKDFSIHPYVIGVLIGDGCCLEKPLTISSVTDEIPKKIASLIPEVTDTPKKNSEHNYNWVFPLKRPYHSAPNLLVKNLQTKEFLKNFPILQKECNFKEIPEEYLFGDIQQRYELLQGLLDTNGSIGLPPKGKIRFTATSMKLALQVRQLCYSLGLGAGTLIEDKREGKYSNTGICYSLSISCKREEKNKLFTLSYKRDRALALEPQKTAHRCDRIKITNIVKLPYKKEMTCILVDNPEHLFLVNDYIVTHNTFVAIANAIEQIEKGRYDKLYYVRNNFEVEGTKEIGALPGDSNAKLRPFLGPLIDIVGSEEYVEQLIEEGKVEQLHLGFLRGRSLKNCFVLVDESQNLTPSHIKMLISRMAENSKLVFTGSYSQIDSKLFRGCQNGIMMMNERLQDNKLYGQIRLNKIERSEVCQLADKLD